MKYFFNGYLLSILVVSFCCQSCVLVQPKLSLYRDKDKKTAIFYPTNSNNLLSCIQNSKELSKADLKNYLQKLPYEDTKKCTLSTTDQLRYICLSLNKNADYTQFRNGISLLQKYIQAHPKEQNSLQGLLLLTKRINHEMIFRSELNNRLHQEISTLQKKIQVLSTQLGNLKKNNSLDQKRIEELQLQIEQLKNIENIIKNRE